MKTCLGGVQVKAEQSIQIEASEGRLAELRSVWDKVGRLRAELEVIKVERDVFRAERETMKVEMDDFRWKNDAMKDTRG